MQIARRRFFQTVLSCCSSPPFSSAGISTLTRRRDGLNLSLHRATLAVPWAALQSRGAKILGTDVRPGKIVQRKGRIYQVLKAQHTQHGRGGATIQVELRDVDTGNKVTERFRTDEAIESVFVEEKSFTYLYQEGNLVTLMDRPSTFEQVEVQKEMFGKAAAYLKEDMEVTLQYYDNKLMSASIPLRVKCKVVEAQPNAKGITASPQYKRVVIDNGITVLAPPFVDIGEEIMVNTTDDSYITRA
ncbi:elongation factor P-like isoform X1 [Zingiber officinale]|uniref:elongation factor P-like isoform X1 n=1 Tax=Zingiber officinale TaxID=94328 RepID=UPI001C4B1CFB|nr:elongation factor P-like isoform X1 [Zingiber officinale]